MTRTTFIALGTLGLAALAAVANTTPEGTGVPSITWSTVDGGGGSSAGGASGGTITLHATIGQPDAGQMSAGGLVLTGGFWARGAADSDPCPGDLNGSGAVDFSDLLTILADWGVCPGCPTDLDGDGSVNFSDLLAVLAQWGPCS